MADENSKPASQLFPSRRTLTPEARERLMQEVKAPYRGLRQFFYLACAASGATGAFIFTIQLLANDGTPETLPNLALQIGVVALMVWLFRLEERARRNQIKK